MLNQKGIAHLFLLILLVIGIGVGIYLVQNPAIFKPKADEETTLCKVSDITTLQDCFAKARADNSSIDKIEISKQIECTSNACRTDLTKRDRPLLIYGTPYTAAGFRRTGSYNYHILLLGDNVTAAPTAPQKVSQVTLKDLIFDDTTETCDESIANNCLSPIVVGPNNSESTIDHVTILHAKTHGIQVENAFKLTIKNSIIYDSDTNGIWFDDARSTPCPNFITCSSDYEKRSKIITIENNLIANSKVAAIEFYAYGNNDYHNSIKGNLIVHNHRDSKFIYCPPHRTDPNTGAVLEVGGHCPGGQLAIGRSEYLDVENNIIRNGRIDGTKPNDIYKPLPGAEGAGKRYEEDLNLHSTGVELSIQLQNVVVNKNKIYNNTGAGIFADYTYFNLAESGFANTVGSPGVVQLTNNFLDRNQFNMGRKDVTNLDNVPGIYNVGNGPSVSLNYPKAFIFADPPICRPQGANQCDTKIRWYSEDQNINVGIKDDAVTSLGTSPDGETGVPWLSKTGAIFEIKSGGAAIASTFATQFNPNPGNPSSTTNPNPSTNSPAAPEPPAPSQPSTPSQPAPAAPASPQACGVGVHSIVYNNNLSRYYTTYEATIDGLLRAGWRDAGYQFWAYNAATPGTVEVHSFYQLPGDATHQDRLLSTYAAGFAGLVNQGWVDEGIVFWAHNSAAPNTIGIHSFVFRNTNSRYYTGDTTLFQPLTDQGWNDEGIKFWAYKTAADSCH